jgi:uncharacterized protein DUF2849
MSKSVAQISVLTANRLSDGVVVFLDDNGDWIEGMPGAAVARSPEAARALEAQGLRDAARNLVVEPYLVEVREAAGGLRPVRTRERVRLAGPSILDDVPGYSPPVPSPRASPTSPRTPPAWGEGQGEGRKLAPAFAAAPHPDPLPVVKNDGEREKRVEAA